jgi:LCP family protein required for cell wall assembly
MRAVSGYPAARPPYGLLVADRPTAIVEPTVATAGRRRRRGLVRALIAIGVTLTVLAVAAATAGALLAHRFDHAVNRANLLAPAARAAAPDAHAPVAGPLNFLVVGSDLRTDAPGDGQRSDTIIIAHLPRTLDHVDLVSIPRDLWVDIPADPSEHFGGDTTKINAAFDYGGGGAGGTRLLSQTLTDLIGIRFDGAVVVDFSGLSRTVDLVGGVRMCVDQRVVSIHTHAVFEPGCRTMTGAQTLDYLRQRYGVTDGDFGRQQHQQEFLKALFQQARQAGVLANPLKLDALLQSVGQSLTVDTGATSLTDLIFALRGLRPDDLTGIRLPFTLDTVGDQSIVREGADVQGLYRALRTDDLSAWATDNPQWVNKI